MKHPLLQLLLLTQGTETSVQVQSQAQPPEPSAEYRLAINKNTLNYQGAGPMAGNVLAWAELQSSRDGTWPEQGTFEV